MKHLTLIIESRYDNVAVACACVSAFTNLCFSPEALAEIDSALTETINNCIEHAYAGAEDQPISLHFRLSDDDLAIEVIDNSDIIPTATLLNKLHEDFDFDPLNIAQLPEGGFGLKIINGCVNAFSYQRIAHQNHWYLKKYRTN